MERKHSDVLIAGLILVGATMWFAGLVHQLFVLDHVTRGVVWFVAAFSAAQIARRMLSDLDLGETAIAAVVAMAIVVGVHAHRVGEPMSVEMLIPIGVALGGAITGALTSRGRSEQIAKVWLVLGGGFAGFGAAVLVVGATMLATEEKGAYGGALLGGAVIGALITALFTPVRGRHSALGQAIAFAVLFGWTNHDGVIQGVLIGAGLGAVLGAIGGGIGGRIADSRKPKADLPAARVS